MTQNLLPWLPLWHCSGGGLGISPIYNNVIQNHNKAIMPFIVHHTSLNC